MRDDATEMQTANVKPSGRLTADRPDGIVAGLMERAKSNLRDTLLDAAEAVIVRQGIASLTLDAVAAEAGVSKGGLLHHFPSKDRLVEALVTRTAEHIRAHHEEAYERTPEGPGRMTRALLSTGLANVNCWSEQCRRSSSAVFVALAQNPSLIEPMRAAYADLHRRIAEDDLPPGMGEVVLAAVDGLWLYWVLGLVPVDQKMIVRLRKVLEEMLEGAKRVRPLRKVNDRPAKRRVRAS
jgi:AcrR family transcriptional regulator